MTIRSKLSKRAILRWFRKLQNRIKGEKGYRLINNDDDIISIDSTQFLIGDPYCEFHSANASVSLHCEALQNRLFDSPAVFPDLPQAGFTAMMENICKEDNPVTTLLKVSQLNRYLRTMAFNCMHSVEVDSLYVVAEEEGFETMFRVEVEVNGKMETLKAQGAEDAFQSAKNAFTTALFILRYFNCSKTIFGVKMDCPVPPEIAHMTFSGLTRFQRVKHIHWSYRAPKQLLRLLHAGAVFF